MTEYQFNKLQFWILLIAAIVFAAILLTSCSTENKAQRKTAWLIVHDKLDDVCARVYPNIDSMEHLDSIHFDTLYVETASEIKIDTVYKNDTVFITHTVKCPPERTITKYVHDSVIIHKSNTAELERQKGETLYWQNQVKEKDKQIQGKDALITQQQKKIEALDKWKIYFIILLSLNVLGFVIRFFVVKKPM